MLAEANGALLRSPLMRIIAHLCSYLLRLFPPFILIAKLYSESEREKFICTFRRAFDSCVRSGGGGGPFDHNLRSAGNYGDASGTGGERCVPALAAVIGLTEKII